MKITRRAFFSTLTALAVAPNLRIEAATFDSWPKGTSPREIGTRVANRFVATPHGNFGRTERPKSIVYPETCTWYGALTFAKLAKNQALTRQLIARFDSLFGPDADLIPTADHVDPSVFGAVPFELYIQTRDKRYLDIGTTIADRQWSMPTPEGLSQQTRFWIDDMYMITALQAQAFRATGKREYIDRAAREMVAYLEKLQQPNGLFYHAPDVPFFWGRGNGWVAAGMTELLRSLPKDHPQRPAIMAGYQKMLATLLTYQDPSSGTWRQLIDKPEAWPESSCTGMFTFAMVTGVKEKWLDTKTYSPAARRAWLGLVQFINADADVRDVCEGTNKKNDYQYYLDRKRNVGDLHGQAPVLWSATAFLR
jgi:unsaturated rhamnogalacturonyl hydrolase